MKTKTVEGITFVKDYHTTRWMKIKSFFSKKFIKALFMGEAALFFVAGFMSTSVLLTHLV